jgi:pyruvate,water dikinase
MPEPGNHGIVVQLRDAADAHEYGGKAASLARLASYDLPVPNGFCIPSGAATCLDPSALEQIRNHLQYLSATQVAVRSSASLEDGRTHSLAGLFRSELEVPATVPDVAHAISKVVRSLSTVALAPYLHRLGIHFGPDMAVLVQVMLQPEIAGVIFTCDPITGNSDFVIEASRNKEVDVQAGRGSPERIVVERGDSTILASTRLSSCASLGGLGAHTVHALINLALKCEDVLGSRQDIEWAIQRGALWILQSRPITGLSENFDE